MDWLTTLNADADTARRILISIGELHPMAVVHYGKNEAAIVPVEWGTREEKVISTQLIRLVAVAKNASVVTFASEAWARRLTRRHGETQDEFATRAHSIPISEAEDRQELLIISGCFFDKGVACSRIRLMEVIRGADGKVIDAKDQPDDDDSIPLRGLLTQLLPKRRPTKEERVAAQKVLVKLGKVTYQ
jgi:hypothetical protein